MKSLPAPNRSKPHGKVRLQNLKLTVAHDIESKPRTQDVKLAKEDKDKDFASLMLSEPLLKGLRASGFVRPSPIQLAAIPNAKIGLDMIVQSKSGTGKTCVYVVTALEMLKRDLPGLQVLVLAPTREIAMQGLEVATQISSHMPNIKISSFIGGLPMSEDKIKAMSCQMAIGTPGRMKQLITEKCLNPDTVRLVVLDEADKLLEQSFLEDTTNILNMLPSSKQVLALSATYPDELATLVEKFMRSPQHVRIAQTNQVLCGVMQFAQLLEYSPSQMKQNQIKQEALLKILSSIPYNQCLVFSNYQTLAQSTADFLNSRGFPSICISAGQDQHRRLQAMQCFKSFQCRILCSTDLTARGIDAENVNLVINYDVPEDHNTYLHRIGRGGRFGSSSISVSLASRNKEEERLRKIVTITESNIKIIQENCLTKNIKDADLETLEGISCSNFDVPPKTSCDEGNLQVENTLMKGEKKGKIKRRGRKNRQREDGNLNVQASCSDLMQNEESVDSILQNECEKLRSLVIPDALITESSDSRANDFSTGSFAKTLNVIDYQDARDASKDYEKELQNAQNHLEYRNVADVLNFVALNKHWPLSEMTVNPTASIEESDSDKIEEMEHEYFSNNQVGTYGSTTMDESFKSDSECSVPEDISGDCSNSSNSLYQTNYSKKQLAEWFAKVKSQSRHIESQAFLASIKKLTEYMHC
eukprot:TRINITY_DN689_c0_g1_i1.p1 TRINITY_DN689_c0_g1~~TRINITY_DN689_c0_g1_i1.p1  ORF type:complete len:701 (-),score=69.58 TRINITY_DN689_c0_g1_i1:320-2422(-)